MIDTANGSTSESAAAPTSFCQQCGRPLSASTARVVGAAVYCEPCLAARMAAGPVPGTGKNAGPSAPQTLHSSAPNPGTAALLGFIPGVGAMYNEQYAKGIVHLMIFAVLVVLSDSVNGIFGIFIAGWEFYMAIEAHHTARARRDHTPLPNPFGLNDIGERWGFGKAWPAGAPNVASVFHDAANAAAHAAQQFHAHQQSHMASAPWSQPVPPPQPPYAAKGEPAKETFGDWSHAAGTETGSAQATAGYQYAQNSATGTQEPWRDTFHSAPASAAHYAGYDPTVPVAPAASRFPAGAVWLIGAGVFFLFATTGVFSFVNRGVVIGLALLALAVWMFVRCMLNTGVTLASDGSSTYALRTLRASRGSAWVGLTGVLYLASTLHILGWNHSWPLYIILGGVLGFAERAVQHPVSVYPPLPPQL